MRKRGRKEKMGRSPCCNKGEVKKGAWTPEEDKKLIDYITNNGHDTWRSFPKLAGLQRCGKSCRLRWTNYLRPDIKRGAFSLEEKQTIFQLHSLHGNKWATIASRLPGRTDNEIKNYWNSHLRKRIPNKTCTPQTNSPSKSMSSSTHHMAEIENARVEANARSSTESTIPHISKSNNFLHKWGSQIEEAFQKPSGSIKVELDSIVTVHVEPRFVFTSTSESCVQSVNEGTRFKDKAEDTMNACDSQNSYEAENSLDLTLDLLLDFPNDGEYLEYV